MSNLANVIELRNELDEQVVKGIELFLNMNKSESTKQLYKQTIEEFFGVSITYMTFGRVTSVSPLEAKSFYDRMLQDGFTKATVARKSGTISSLYNYLINELVEKKDGKFVALLSVNPLGNYKISYQNENYGTFSEEEVKAIIKIAEEDGRHDLALYYSLLVVSAVRAEQVVELNISQFECRHDEYYIVGSDKGKKGLKKQYEVKISKELYEKCKELADKNGKIFNFTRKTALNRLVGANNRPYENSYCAKIGLSKEMVQNRNLVLHSFKRSSAMLALGYVDNAKQLADHLHHSNIQTSSIYLDKYNESKKESIGQKLYKQLNGQIDSIEEQLNKMTKSELINLILEHKESIFS